MMIIRCRSWILSTRTSEMLRTFCTVVSPALKESANDNRLYRMLSQLGATGGKIAQTLNQYLREGNLVEDFELLRCTRDLRRYGNYQHALQVMEWMDKRGIKIYDTDLALRLELISKVHGVSAAEDYFYNVSPRLQTRNTYGALLNTYCKLKMADKALALFKIIKLKDFATTLAFDNIMILYIGLDQPEKVPSLVEEMKERKIQLSTLTYSRWMQSFSLLGDIEGVERVFQEIRRDRYETCDWTTYRDIAGAYVKAGLVEKAEVALELLENEIKQHSSREPYHFLITIYSSLNNQEQVHRISSLLKSSFATTRNRSYIIILQALSKVNDLEGMKKWFEEWELNYHSHDMRVPNVVISCYLRHNMVEEAELVFHGSVKRSHGPFVHTLVLFMKHYLASLQIDLAMKCFEAAAARPERCNWYFHRGSIDEFLEYFEKEKDVEGAEKLFKILQKLNCVDDKVYSHLLQTYIAAGKTEPDMRQRIKRDGIVVTPELRNMLKKVY